MGTFEFLMILAMLVCVLLILVILAQNPKGGGLSSSFVGGGGGQMFGVKQTNDFLDKSTWTLGGIVVALIILGSTMKPNPKASYNIQSVVPSVENTTPTSDAAGDATNDSSAAEQTTPEE